MTCVFQDVLKWQHQAKAAEFAPGFRSDCCFKICVSELRKNSSSTLECKRQTEEPRPACASSCMVSSS